MNGIAKLGLPAVLAGFSEDAGRKIAARRGYDAAVAARKVTDLILLGACIATELVQEQDRLPGASVFEEKLYAVTFGIGHVRLTQTELTTCPPSTGMTAPVI